MNEVHSICANCSGWGRNWDRDEGQFEPVNDNPVEWKK